MKNIKSHSFKYIIFILLISIFFEGCLSSNTIDVKDEIIQEIIPVSKLPKNDNNEHYVGIYSLGSYEYFTDHKIGLKKAGSVLGVNTEYLGPPDDNIDKMIECFEYAIEKKVDGIVSFGADDRLAKMINRAADNNIPTVTVDGDIKNSRRIAFVGTGNYNAGYLGGNKLAEIIGKKGNVMILTETNIDLHEERTRGYLDALKQYPEIKVVQIGDTKSNPDAAYDAVKKALEGKDIISGIACTDYFGGASAAIAVEEKNLQGTVKILAMDRNRYVLEKIAEGVITATLVQQTVLMPFYAMMILYNYNHNSVPVVLNSKEAGITGAPVEIDTGVFIIDQTNYKYFIR